MVTVATVPIVVTVLLFILGKVRCASISYGPLLVTFVYPEEFDSCAKTPVWIRRVGVKGIRLGSSVPELPPLRDLRIVIIQSRKDLC